MRRIMQQNKEADQKDELEWEQRIVEWRQKRATFAAEMAAKRATPAADDANSDSDADSGDDNSDDDDEKDADMAGTESPTEEEMAGLDKKARKELKKARQPLTDSSRRSLLAARPSTVFDTTPGWFQCPPRSRRTTQAKVATPRAH